MHDRAKPCIGKIGALYIALSLIAWNGASNAVASTLSVPPSGNSQWTLNPPPRQDIGPLIAGTPPTTAVVGQPFSFQPSITAAAAANGDKLRFFVTNRPSWASFDTVTGQLWGIPQATDLGSHEQIAIGANDGTHTQALRQFAVNVVSAGKSHYGHYFSTHYSDTPATAAMLCEKAGVSGVVWHQTWNQVEPSPGVYNFSSFDKVLATIAASHNPHCQLWLFVEFKSYRNSPVRNPCPAYLQAKHSGLNVIGGRAATCFMWESVVTDAYVAMIKAAAAHFDRNPRIEGFIIQESSLGFNGPYSQAVARGGTYTPTAWRNALINIISECGAAFSNSHCVSFLNFLQGNQSYLYEVSAAISAIPDNRVCISGPDLLPTNPALYRGRDAIYQVISRHTGCRSISAQNASYQVGGCSLQCMFDFAVSGTVGAFPASAPLTGGLCVNSYLFWNDRANKSRTGLDWKNALPVIASHPYGPDWYKQCAGSRGPP
jgi:hypothetical protein